MISLSHLNKITQFTFFFTILIFNSALAVTAVDIWKKKENQNEQNNQTSEEEITIQSPILSDDVGEEKLSIDEKKIEESDHTVIGIFDPEKNDFNLNMWSSSDGEDIKNILKRIDKLKLSQFSEDLLFQVLFTNAYPPKTNLSSYEFLKIKIDWLIKNKRIIETDQAKRIRENVYVGPQFDDEEIKHFLDSNKITYQKFDRQSLLQNTAKLISDGKIVGWYQGKMEWGPRSLGNRSILADPREAKMKDILNEKIKHRESFRPFAPSILEEHTTDYFDIDIPSPYMLMVTSVKQPDKIPAVTHVDGTGRLQTVSKQANPLYYDLINEFYKLTDVPVVINTSMNVMGEPIVNTPEQAYNMIKKTDMDYIVMGNNLVSKLDTEV